MVCDEEIELYGTRLWQFLILDQCLRYAILIKRTPRDIPPGYEEELSDYGPWLTDGHCGKTIGWGYEIRKHLGKERFGSLGKYGSLECVNGPHISDTTWYLIIDWLTPEEARKEYGEISRVTLGPQRGFRSVTFGKTTFTNPRLNPINREIEVPKEKIVVLQKGDRRLVIDSD